MKERHKDMLMLTGTVGGALALREAVRRRRTIDLRGKTVLITGGSRGLGLLMAREAANQGANLAICARDTEELKRAQEDLTRRGARVAAVRCDATNKGQVEAMIRIVHECFGRVDVLINNAGVIQAGPSEVMTPQDYEEAMKVHFWAPLYTTLAVLPEMRRRRSGRIVNISSIGGKVSVPHLLPYSASKFALTGFSEGLRAELAKDGILVTTVCPGLLRTGSARHAYVKGQHRTEYALFSIMDALPLFSMNAERAARQIIAACKRGDPELVLSVQAKLGAAFHGLFPGLTADALGLVNRFLPGPGESGTERVQGKDSESALSPSLLTILNEKAAMNNNEMSEGVG
jgi:short-subunit dehydrogenase